MKTTGTSKIIGTKVADSSLYRTRGDGNPAIISVLHPGDPSPYKPHFNAYDWKFSVHAEALENQRLHCTYFTYTFAKEPTAKEARRLGQAWIRGVKKYDQKKNALIANDLANEPTKLGSVPRAVAQRRALSRIRRVLPGTQGPCQTKTAQAIEDIYCKHYGKMRFFLVAERGEKTNRLHLHGLVWTPSHYMWDEWEQSKALRWKHGFWEHKLVTDTPHKVANYVAKYCAKSPIGKPICNSRFGSTTITALLSISQFKTMAIASLPMVQRLLQRLYLTSNYPTSKRLNYLALSDNALTTSRPGPLILRPETSLGARCLEEMSCSDVVEVFKNTEAYRRNVRRLAREAVATCKNIIAARPTIGLADALTGIYTFGHPLRRCDPALQADTVAFKTYTHRRIRRVFTTSPHV